MSDPRQQRMYSLSSKAIAALEERAKATGEKMSRIVEQGIYLACQLPPPEPDEENDGPGETRTMRDVLAALGAMPRGWHTTGAIAKELGVSFGVTRKALQALKREGKVFLWGPGEEMFDGSRSLCWGVRPGLDVAREMISTWLKTGRDPKVEPDRFIDTVVAPLRKLALGMGTDAKIVRAAVAKALDVHPDDTRIESFLELEARRARELAEETAELETLVAAERKRIADQVAAEEAAMREYDSGKAKSE